MKSFLSAIVILLITESLSQDPGVNDKIHAIPKFTTPPNIFS